MTGFVPPKDSPLYKVMFNNGSLNNYSVVNQKPVSQNITNKLPESSPLYKIVFSEELITNNGNSVNEEPSKEPSKEKQNISESNISSVTFSKIDNTNTNIVSDTKIKNDTNKLNKPEKIIGKFELTMSYAGGMQIPPSQKVNTSKPYNVVSGSPYVTPPPASRAYSTGALPYSGSSSYYKYKFAKH